MDVTASTQRVASRYQARQVARFYTARQFTPESWATYKQKHPGAKEQDHQISKAQGKSPKDKGPSKLPPARTVREKLDRVIQSVSGVSAAVVKALRAAPEKVQQFVTDEKYRSEVTSAIAKAAKAAPGKLKKQILASGKSELKAIFSDTPRILASLALERRRPTKAEAKTLYGVSVYVAGTILAMQGDAGAAGAVLMGAKAFGHSLGLHVGIKAMNRVADEGFLGYEAVESGATGAGIANALPVNTSDLPGLNHIWDAVTSLVAAEKKPAPTLDKMVERLIAVVTEEFERGLTDGDIIEILKGDQP